MNITTLQERITKANAKIEKKTNTIAKYHKTIAKKQAELKKITGRENFTEENYWELRRQGNESDWVHDAYWVLSDIRSAEEGIKNNTKQIEETRKTIAKYEAQLAGEIERESTYIKEVPESMKQMQADLEKVWNEYDEARKARMYKAYKELGYTEFFNKYTYADYEIATKPLDDIHKQNERDAKAMVINLYNRVKDITGEVTDWYGIHCTYGAHGMPTLNGIVYGKEGNAEVESITAGGYNIQRFHIRVLVKAS